MGFCFSGLSQITLNDNLENLGGWAFYQCTNLSNITLAKSLKVIPTYAFGGCTNLENITIPTNITTIERNVFANSGLQSITIEDASGWALVTNNVFYYNNLFVITYRFTVSLMFADLMIFSLAENPS